MRERGEEGVSNQSVRVVNNGKGSGLNTEASLRERKPSIWRVSFVCRGSSQ